MTAMKHKIYDWTFDKDAWSCALKEAVKDIGHRELADLIGVDHSTLSNWIAQRHTGGYTWPFMVNLLKVCNLLDLDPRTFFVLEE